MDLVTKNSFINYLHYKQESKVINYLSYFSNNQKQGSVYNTLNINTDYGFLNFINIKTYMYNINTFYSFSVNLIMTFSFLTLIVLLMLNSFKYILFLKKFNYTLNHELGLTIDFFLLILLFLITNVLLFFNFNYIFITTNNIISVLLLNIFLIISLVIQTPIIFLYNISIFLFQKIKGTSKKNNLIIQTVEDVVGLLTFNIRYLLQTIRWFLTLISLFLLHEYYYEMGVFFTQYNKSVFINSIFNTFIIVARALFEYIDLLFIMSVQLTAFLLVIFWLLSFLFSTNIKNIFETVFYKN